MLADQPYSNSPLYSFLRTSLQKNVNTRRGTLPFPAATAASLFPCDRLKGYCGQSHTSFWSCSERDINCALW